MGYCVEKIKYKGHDPEKAHGRTVQVFAQNDGTVDGYCFSEDVYVPDPYGDGRKVEDLPPRKEKTPEEIEEEIAEISGYQTITVHGRKLRAETLERFGAKVSVSERDGVSPTAIYWPATKKGKLVAYHVKPLWKGGFPYFVGDGKGTDPLNWENAKVSGAYRLFITEGPEDMASVDRIYEMYNKNDKYHPAIISLPRGAGSAKSSLQAIAEKIRKTFKEVVLCFDDDDAGKRAVHDAMLVLPFAKSVTLPFKDANECILKGAAKAAYNALSFQMEKPKNSKLVFARDLHESAREEAKWGQFTYPFASLNDALRGMRWGETSYLGAGVA